jgi:hypothetical protein
MEIPTVPEKHPKVLMVFVGSFADQKRVLGHELNNNQRLST